MPSPSDLVTEAFAQAETYASNAQGQLADFTAALRAAIQTAPLVDLTFEPVAAPTSGTAPSSTPTYSAPTDYLDPTNTMTMVGTLYTALTGRLAGGTGLEPTVEAAIWDRARSRELEVAQQAIDDVTIQAEALGFELPPGVLNEGIRRETNVYFDRVSGLSRDIAIKQADLEQTNMRDATERANQFISEASGYLNALSEINNRRANVAVSIYDGEIRSFVATVESFRAQVESDVKRWEVQVKQYEAEMHFVQDNAKLNTEITRANLAMILEAGKVGAQVYSQLVAAAYHIINATAHVQAESGTRVNYQYNGDVTGTISPLTSI